LRKMSATGPDTTKIIVDSMHGRLARYLRIMGIDTLYAKQLSDTEIEALVLNENRVLVTGDKNLFTRVVRMGGKAVYIHPSLTLPRAIALLSMILDVPINIDLLKTRCPLCNTLLKQTSKPTIYYSVARNTYFVCPQCGNTYWVGKHWYIINKVMEEARIWRKMLLSPRS